MKINIRPEDEVTGMVQACVDYVNGDLTGVGFQVAMRGALLDTDNPRHLMWIAKAVAYAYDLAD